MNRKMIISGCVYFGLNLYLLYYARNERKKRM